MEDQSALLNQLRIDRSTATPPRGARAWWLAAGAAIVVLVLALWWWTRTPAVPVHTAVAQAVVTGASGAGSSILDASGYVVARRQATVASKITGKMVELDIEEGDHVKTGQIIAKLDDSNIRAQVNQARAQLDFAKAGLAEIQVNRANAQRDFDRQSSLLEKHYVSQAAVDNSHTALDALTAQLATQRSNVEVAERNVNVAERSLDDTIVRAPFAGVITVKAAQPGEIVSPISAGGGFTRTGIGTIVDMDSLEIQVDVNENFINRVQPAQAVKAKLNAYPDWQIPGHVIAVIPTADRSKGTVQVRIGIDEKDARILPEMGVRVAFLDAAADGANGANRAGAAAAAVVRLPKAAIDLSGAAAGTGNVYVLRGDTVERRAVRVGGTTEDAIDVISGLAAGDRVAVGDFNQLKDGATVRVEP